MTVVSMNYLLESGVHFGHQTKRWNPKMKEYIHTSRDGIYIIDLQKTAAKIEEAYQVLADISERGGKALFVGTRKQASQAIKDEALRSNSFFICERWLGGTLTNFKTIRQRVKRLEQLEKMEEDGTFEVLPKKEVVGLRKERNKLNLIFEGIRDMYKLPDVLFVVDPIKEEIAVREARKLNIPVIGIVDTNCDPDMVDYVIPGNDDAIRAVKLITAIMANAINSKIGGPIVEFGQASEDGDNVDEIMQKAVETVKSKDSKKGRDFGRDKRRKPVKYTKMTDKEADQNKKETATKDKEVVSKEEVKIAPKQTAEKKVESDKKTKPTEKVTETDKKTELVEKEVASDKKEKKSEKKTTTEKKAPKKAVKQEDLSALTVAELKQKAKEKNIKGYSTMKKAELLDALK